MLKLNEVYKGTVLKIEKTYAILDVQNVRGLIHISEISDYLVKDINDYVQVGKTYEFKLVNADFKKNKYYFSLKKLNPKLIKKRDNIIETTTGFKNVFNKLQESLK
jgi:general stress protein 13/S1 RNA binding domain protein